MRCADIGVVSLAGIGAERLIVGTTLPNTEHDLIEAEALASLVVRSRSPDAIRAFVDFARVEAAALLDDHVGILLVVAGELLKHRTLDGRMIDVIIGAA